MKRRQQRHADDRRSAAKYAEIVADLTRLLRLFKQPKNSRQVPLDGMRLLSWCQVCVAARRPGGQHAPCLCPACLPLKNLT